MSRHPFDLTIGAQLAERATPATPVELAVAIIEAARAPCLACPACNSTRLQRNGHAHGLQRFRCRICRRSFNSLTGTPLARLRYKAKWLSYCETLLDPATTVRDAAARVQVHRNTSFRWRHRMLHLTKYDRHYPLRDVVEAEEIRLRESRKGARKLERPARKRGGADGACMDADQVCVLVARDRHGRTHDALAGRGPLTLDHLQRHLKPVLTEGVLIVTGSPVPFRQFAVAAGFAHDTARPDSGVRDAAHCDLGNVSAYLGRLRNWLQHFRGVATRYLENYCGWRWALDGQRINSPAALLRCAVGMPPLAGDSAAAVSWISALPGGGARGRARPVR